MALVYPRSKMFVLHHSGVAAPLTGSVALTNLRTVNVPAGAMGPNGGVRISGLFSYTNSANNKTIGVRFGGTLLYNLVVTTSAQNRFSISIHNRNSEASQIAAPNAISGGYGQTTGTIITTAIDTSVLQQILFQGTLANSGENITLEYSMVELLRG